MNIISNHFRVSIRNTGYSMTCAHALKVQMKGVIQDIPDYVQERYMPLFLEQ